MAKAKQRRELLALIEQAGGRAEETRRGHLRVYGPNGLTHLSMACTGPRSWANNVAALARIGLGRVAP